MTTFSIFDYCYRDAANYKSWGTLLLEGVVLKEEIERIVSILDGGEFFIAEQLSIPTLYHELWELSGGPTDEDHVWHQFHELRQAENEELSLPVWGTVKELVARFSGVQRWDETLSPHWDNPSPHWHI